MNKKQSKARMNVFLFVLLALTVICLGDMIFTANAPQPGMGVHFHALCGFIMTGASFFHILHHHKWIMAAMKGKLKGRALIALLMNTMVFVLMILACTSGHEAMEAPGISIFHAVVGSFAILGLFIHSIRHIRRVVKTPTRKITGTCEPVVQNIQRS
jgi:hypothetical protein